MKVLLLCGYRSLDPLEKAVGLERDGEGRTLIDGRILQLKAMGLSVITVLSGETADEQLRHSPLIAQTDMAFANGRNLLANIQEGLTLLKEEACFALPVEVPPPPQEVWKFLLNEYGKLGFATEECGLQTAMCHFPLLLTHHGCQRLQNTEGLTSLVDARLKYVHLSA